MKIFLRMMMAAGIVISSSAFAAPLFEVSPLLGEYVYEGEMQLVQARKIEIVNDGLSEEGQARLAALKSEGYTCEHVIQASFRCTMFLKDASIPPKVRRQLDLAHQGWLKVTFDAPVGKPERVTEGDRFEEWDVVQSGVAAGRKFSRYTIQVLVVNDGPMPELMHKIKLTTAEQSTEWRYRVLGSDQLGFWADTSVSGPSGWTAYSVELVMKKAASR